MLIIRRYLLFVVFAINVLLLAVACTEPAPSIQPPPTAEPIPVHLWLGFEDGTQPLADHVVANYTAENVVIHTVFANGDVLLDDLAADQIDVAFVYSLPPNPAVWFSPVALDGVVLFVHPDNPLTDLNQQDGQAIFAGRGGQPWVLHTRENGAGVRTVFRDRLMAEQRVAITAVTQTSEAALHTAVAADPQAIGYGSMANLPADLKPLSINGMSANPNTVGTQQYLLTTPIYAAATAEPQRELRALIGWLQSAETQAELGGVYGRVR